MPAEKSADEANRDWAAPPLVETAAALPASAAAWPDALRRFFARHEGFGIDSDHYLRICRRSEVRRVAQADSWLLDWEGWNDFVGLKIGISSFNDQILLVERAPVCAAGSVLMVGPDIAGPGGRGASLIEHTIVLAESLTGWMKHLESCGWIEHAIFPGDVKDLAGTEQERIAAHYHRLNPNSHWSSFLDD